MSDKLTSPAEDDSNKSSLEHVGDEAAPGCSTSSTSAGTTTEKDDHGGEKEKDEDDEQTVTMLDVLQDETELEEDAKAVLGAVDEKCCTYFTGGYMKRQPLYSCLTCCAAAAKGQPEKEEREGASAVAAASKPPQAGPAGVCLACSYHCHEGHDLVELYTKRRFKCDCGNSKFLDKCKLEDNKEPENKDNRYNQNFQGFYCTCHRPYPDPEDPISDQMIQCVLCEDWFHGRHLGLADKPPADTSYSEMICAACVGKNTFLLAYKGLAVTMVKKGDCGNGDDSTVSELDVTGEHGEGAPEVGGVGAGADVGGCPVAKLQSSGAGGNASAEAVALFMVQEWRNQLCKCSDCEKIYLEHDVDFLLDPEDTVHHYEAQSKKNAESGYEEGMRALSGMDRVKQVEAIQSYNQMKGNLMDYLKKFATNGKVVRQEDIADFFNQMQARKRQKVEIPKFCR